RLGSLVRRPDSQIAFGSRSDGRSRSGFAADVVAFRERSWGKGTLSSGRVPGRECDPASRQAAAPSRLSRHHRSGPNRRSHARRAAVVVFQRTLRHLVLPADDGFCQLQRRSRTVCLCRGVTAWQRGSSGGRGRHAAAFGEDDSSPSSWSTDSGTPGWRVRASDKDPKDNPRFVITNMKQSPQWIYEHIYCQRGDIENRIKELHDLEIDRTSCTSFWANQFRVLLTAAAYVLMQELRLRAAGTACARAQVCMLRERLLKLGARVLVSVRRVVVHLPASFPFLPAFRRVALALGAATG